MNYLLERLVHWPLLSLSAHSQYHVCFTLLLGVTISQD